jgi:hypothetical protein
MQIISKNYRNLPIDLIPKYKKNEGKHPISLLPQDFMSQ